MKDLLCIGTFAAKLLCLVVFVAVLRPNGIKAVSASSELEHCQIEHSGGVARRQTSARC
jgi:hypothetical protein